jgi:DNA-binding transcriptional ArsR family regulator
MMMFYRRTKLKSSLAETCDRFFSILSNPTRLAILEYLREGPKNVKQLSELLSQEQSMVSHNLKPLVECRFVFVERKWKERLYSLNKETIEPIFKLFNFHAQKYCPKKGACLKDWRNRRDKLEMAYINHH